MSNVVEFTGTPTPSTMPTAELRSATSLLIERMQFLRAAGLSFGGRRNMYEILGYPDVISPEQYRNRYTRGGIAGRVVDALPRATWRAGGEIVEDENPEVSTTLETTWVALEKRLRLMAMFLRLDILAQQGRYACLLLGAPGEFNAELKKGNPDKLLYVTPFAEEDARILEWELDEQNPRFGQPNSYQLSRLSPNSLALFGARNVPAFTPTAFNLPVHWSRIIHVPAEGILDNDVFGPPALERVWNLIDDLDKVIGGGAEAFWLRANQGLQLNIDKDITNLSPEEKADLQKQADEYQHSIRRMLRTRGVEVNTLGSDVANFSNPADAVVTQIAGAKAIPKRILTGSEMGELASSQDRENFRDQVNGRQTGYAEPYIIRPFLDRLMRYGYLPAAKSGPDGYEWKWSHLQVLTETEKAEGASKWAQVNASSGMPVFTTAEIREKWYGLPPLTPEQVQKEKELAKPLEPPPPPPGSTVDEQGNVLGPDGKPMMGPDGQPMKAPNGPVQGKPSLQSAPPQAGGKNATPGDEEDDTTDESVPAGVRKKVSKAGPRAAATAVPDELFGVVAVLEHAIRTGDTATIDRVVGITHAESAPSIVLPTVEIHQPDKKATKKTIVYGDVNGVMRPIGIEEVEP